MNAAFVSEKLRLESGLWVIFKALILPWLIWLNAWLGLENIGINQPLANTACPYAATLFSAWSSSDYGVELASSNTEELQISWSSFQRVAFYQRGSISSWNCFRHRLSSLWAQHQALKFLWGPFKLAICSFNGKFHWRKLLIGRANINQLPNWNQGM